MFAPEPSAQQSDLLTPLGAAGGNGVLMSPLTRSCGTLHKSIQVTSEPNVADLRREAYLTVQLKIRHLYSDRLHHAVLRVVALHHVQLIKMNYGGKTPVGLNKTFKE